MCLLLRLVMVFCYSEYNSVSIGLLRLFKVECKKMLFDGSMLVSLKWRHYPLIFFTDRSGVAFIMSVTKVEAIN
ncbi:hypothetical protein VNO77_21138 [Canavalia gladiata]|uniref:Uncharacterized protein n=1 Tax=Canavalia gladiata TaxID=3824 RepID=A0AAN9LRE9_CANGL